MSDEADLDRDPALARRWGAIRTRLESSSESLLTQGVVVAKATSSGRRAWAVRYVDRSGAAPSHRSVFLGDDPRLIALARRQLAHYRTLGRLADEVAGHARVAASASFAVRRLVARTGGGRAGRGDAP